MAPFYTVSKSHGDIEWYIYMVIIYAHPPEPSRMLSKQLFYQLLVSA